MAVPETQTPQYIDDSETEDQHQLRQFYEKNPWRHIKEELPAGYRIRQVLDRYVRIEPVLEDTHRYLPIPVDLPWDPTSDSHISYQEMGPTNWKEVPYT